MVERYRDFILYRLIGKSKRTLEQIGRKYHVTREIIRQNELKVQKILRNCLIRGQNEHFVHYRELFAERLCAVPDEAFNFAIEYICFHNPKLWAIVGFFQRS